MTAPRIDICPEHSAQFVRTVAPEPDAIQEEMAAEAEARGDRFPGEGSFPTVGPTVGAWLYGKLEAKAPPFRASPERIAFWLPARCNLATGMKPTDSIQPPTMA